MHMNRIKKTPTAIFLTIIFSGILGLIFYQIFPSMLAIALNIPVMLMLLSLTALVIYGIYKLVRRLLGQ